MGSTQLPTGPRGTLLLGNLVAFGEDPLRFLENCVRDHGDFVKLRFLHRTVFLVNRPADIEAVLAIQGKNFHKTAGYRTPFMRRLFGQGLLTSEGALWTQQRRLAQPAFHRERIANYARVIVEYADEMARTWPATSERDVHADVMRLTTRVVVRTLFNAEVPPAIAQLGEASAVVLEHFTQQWSFWRLLSMLFPNSGSRAFENVMGEIDAFIYSLVQKRRQEGGEGDDLLSMLLHARDEGGIGMTDQQLRDELVTLMVAGLDTTALAVSWSLYLLAMNPAAQGRVRAELDAVLGGRRPGIGDLGQFRYLDAVLKETMRLYPPAWLVGREAMSDCQIGGCTLRKGHSVVMSQWLQHRDARHFPEPEAFKPERWLETPATQLPRFAYFPFGGGPRICIGSAFATMEATLVLACILGQFEVNCAPAYVVVPWPTITLQPRNGIWLSLQARARVPDDRIPQSLLPSG